MVSINHEGMRGEIGSQAPQATVFGWVSKYGTPMFELIKQTFD